MYRYILKTDKHTLILGKRGDKKFTLTSYRTNKKMEITQTGGVGDFTAETHPRNSLSMNRENDSKISPR